MVEVSVYPQIRKSFPAALSGIICCELMNTSFDENLWEKIKVLESRIRKSYTLDNIREQINISSTREAYKAFGADPNRYRPSADSLYRRIVKGNSIYKVSTLVDIINMVSLNTGYSIGGYDLDKIKGSVEIGIGRKDEEYEGIGRGSINIEGLQVLRDAQGPFGTATSDHVRTAVDLETKSFYMHIHAYSGLINLEEAIGFSTDALIKYVSARNIETRVV